MYDIGFKHTYTKSLLNRFSEANWLSMNTKTRRIRVQSIIDDLVKTIDTDIDVVLQNMRAKYRVKYTTITNDIRNHYSTLHLVQIIIEYANGRFDPISTNAFLYNPTVENKWFRNANQELCFNAVEEQNAKESINSLKVTSQQQMFYHATNWKNIQKIFRSGPNHKKGRFCLDFGIRQSFYVTPDINTAIEWASRNMFNNEGGIIVFALNLSSLTRSNFFPSPNDKWKTLVKNSRMCQTSKNDLDAFNFVYGPMLKNTRDIKELDVEAMTHLPIKWQLASKNVMSDRFLKESMIGAIFLKRV